MYQIKPDLNKENILSIISEIDIFRAYCSNFKKPGEMFHSEVRKDPNPSCSIINYRGRMMYSDFGDVKGLSCFDYVMYKYKVDYRTALDIINRDFNLDLDGKEVDNIIPVKNPIAVYEQYDKIYIGNSVIKVHYKEWDDISIDYMNQHKLDYRRVEDKFRVRPIDYYWINGYQFKAAKLAFTWYLGLYEGRAIYKIYQPLEKKYKWFHNLNQNIIQGWHQLPKTGKILVITKAYKDVLCFDNFDIPSIAPGAEGWTIPDKVLDNLFQRFDTILSQFDWDYTGIKGMNKLRREYGIQPIPIVQGRFSNLVQNKSYWKDKDFADLCKNNSLQNIQEEINLIKYKLNL
jgi:hypothetical protein